MMVSTPLPESTSRTLSNACCDSACVSLPTYSGPVTPLVRRYEQIACVIARMCASLKVPRSEDPRWPLVPKLTLCVASVVSGLRS